MTKHSDLTDNKYGPITVIQKGYRTKRKDGKGTRIYWLAKCYCGKYIYATRYKLENTYNNRINCWHKLKIERSFFNDPNCTNN